MSALQQAIEQSLARAAEPGPDWLTGYRGDARQRALELGLPHPKLEDWRFTHLKELSELSVHPAPTLPSGGAEAARRLLGEAADHAIVIANGCVHLPSTLPSPISVKDLGGALAREPQLLAENLITAQGAPSVFAQLNAALFNDLLLLHIPEGVEVTEPLFIVHVTQEGETPVSYPRVLVVAGTHSRVRLTELFTAPDQTPTLTSSVTQVVCKPGAQVHHTRAIHGSAQSRLVGLLSAELQRDSRYQSTLVALGGKLSRQETDIRLCGPGAEASLDGLYLVNSDEQTDLRTRVDHLTPQASSHQRYRGILRGTGSAIFDGTVFVRRDAQGTSAHQENRNLLLSDEATINTKPHLEIDADDVQCSHGATVGKLNQDELFYLQSRGISEAAARAIVTFAFARQVVDSGLVEERKRLARAVLERLDHPELLELLDSPVTPEGEEGAAE